MMQSHQSGERVRPKLPPAEKVAAHATRGRRSTARMQQINRHVGARIRERRIMLGLTLQRLADAIGVAHQQAHKYECGINCISAGRLYQIASALGTPVSYFFEGFDEQKVPARARHERQSLELAQNFVQIPSKRHKEVLAHLARVLAAT
jgi:transcriptional regulator with XRE-family HTH domain